ncbi:MAG: SDR family oxidoreductase [Alphaproteobacteria bacterium]
MSAPLPFDRSAHDDATADDRRCAIVTGAAGGLGAAIACQLLDAGMCVALVDASPAVEEAASSLAREGFGAVPFRCDVTDLQAIAASVDDVIDSLGVPYALVNAAGIGPLSPVLEITPAMWNDVMAVNLGGTFWFSQAVARSMVRERRGRIVNIASISGERAGFGRAAYGTSKAAVIHLTRQLAVELGPFGVTVNAVGPGPVDTELALRHHTPEMRADYHATIPLGRYGTPEEIAAVVRFLCSDGAAYVNGQTLFVDGGFTAGGVAVKMAQDHAGAAPAPARQEEQGGCDEG